MRKNLLMILFVLSLTILFGKSENVYGEDVIDSGSCGENATWILSGTSTDMVLTISGEGDMYQYDASSIPWVDDRSKIKRVVVEEGITQIGDYAFYSLNKATEFLLPNSLESIGDYAFSDEISLSSISLPESVTNIGLKAFSGCSKLNSIVIPNGVSGLYATFSGCSNLTNITIPDSVTIIGDYAFYECSSLTSVSIPDSVESIGWEAFRGCNSLTSISISDSVTSIGGYAFYECSCLIGVSIPDSVESVGWEAFYGCGRLTRVDITDIVSWLRITFSDSLSNPLCNGADLYINGELATNITVPTSVKSIPRYAFVNCNSLIIITLPGSVTSIGDYAFYECSSLTNVVIPNSVTSIGESAFQRCGNLERIEIPDSVTIIKEGTFRDCVSLNSVVIPNSVTSIEGATYGYGAFSNCSSLTNIVIPDSVITIGSFAFSDCSSMSSIVIPDSVTSIGEWAFYECSNLTSINIPRNLTHIEEGTFFQCNSLTDITISDNITSIGSQAFEGCCKLKTVVLPDSVEDIGDSAFTSCMVKYKARWFYYDPYGQKKTTDSVPRIFGDTRYQTSLSIAYDITDRLGKSYQDLDAVILACGNNYPDALAGSYLSCVIDAPILLVNTDPYTIESIRWFIEDKVKVGGRIYLLGGAAVVPATVVNGLKGFDIIRLWGNNRYETNIAILKEAAKFINNNEIVVCTGTGYADSLSAAALGKPVLLVSNALEDIQKNYLESTIVEDIYIIGGSGAVSDRIKNELSAYGTTTRIGGATRYETSVNVARRFFDNPPAGVLAYAQNFPDGLCGGTLAYAMGGPLILTSNYNPMVAEVYAEEQGMVYGAVLGGPALISDSSAKRIFRCSNIYEKW